MLLNLKFYYISSLFLFMMSVFFLFFGISFMVVEKTIFIEWEFFSIQSLSVVMTLLFDWMSMMFLSCVLFISSMVVMYSSDYMKGDMNIIRFVLLVLMFVFSMSMLIISPNLISILLGWDGLGLVSYCLVIYYQNVKSFNAGMLTALSNRVGDVAILMSIAWMLNFGSWNYIFYMDYMFNNKDMWLISGFIILAGMTKSAQIPFSAWLPAAMAAPTPVSSLVHSSTLVTAGVYLLIRFSPIITGGIFWNFLFFISVLTMFMAGLGANFEFDLKKIIALSTLSQLGVMMSILSLGYPLLSFFHLLTHAMFKALLFLCAGCMIHSIKDWQDIRSLGCMGLMMPLTSSCFNVANLALCGMPFLAGFYSKDLILEVLEMSFLNVLMFILYFISTGLTVCYSFRLVFYSMMGDLNLMSYSSLHDDSFKMSWPMIFLSLMGIMVGSIMSWMMFSSMELICLPFYLKLLTLFVCLVGAWMGLEINQLKIFMQSMFLKSEMMISFMGSMWFMPFLSSQNTMKNPLEQGNYYMKSMDFGWSEYLSAQGLYMNLYSLSKSTQLFQDNSIKIYFMTFMLWVMVIFFIMSMF
uniref:NADH-ubiquinone oxidoreductase chain 5 n=1 Tax=Pedetontus zhejiangensis TaxID=554671 RepID=A0A7L8EYZ8_9INSE|nr:NADH dehydrogenase subunit 5 [Pedetontus zhejiangensis]QOE17740.1 NADH dehydrogenase subunit 5 [Pedetontus zhejiangensis]